MTEVKDRDFVVPGDEIIKSMDYLPGRNCFRENDSIFAKRLGLVSIENRVISVIPLSGVYIPRTGDMVIGEVKDIQSNGWIVDIDSSYRVFLPLSGVREFIDTTKTDLSRIYDVGDMIYAKVSLIKNAESIHISMQDTRSRKFRDGRIIMIGPAKVPRLIGKQGSMVNLVKTKTGCKISVGQNGRIWLEGEKEELAIKAIKTIEKESYINGLTDKISELLEKGIKEKDSNEKGKQ